MASDRGLRSIPAFDALLWMFVAIGAGLRLWRLTGMEFKADEFTHMLGAYQAAQAPWSAPLLIAQSTTASPGVFFYQFLALPVSLTQNPVTVTLFIALVNVAAIPVLYILLRRLFGSTVALWSTALFATSPWLIIFSRKIWNPDLLAPFLIVTFFFLYSAMRRYAAWKVYAFAVLLALASQLHLSVWLALFPLLPLGLLLRPWRRPAHLAGGIAAFVATYLLTLGPQLGEFVAALLGPTEPAGYSMAHLAVRNGLVAGALVSGLGFEYLLGPSGYAAFAQHPVVAVAQAGFVLHAVLIAVAAAHAVRRLLHAARSSFSDVGDRLLLTIVLMACVLNALYLVFRVVSYPHYQVILAVVPPVLVALLLAQLRERLASWGPVVARALLAVVLVANVTFMTAFLTFVHERPGLIDGDYGEPYFVDRERKERELQEALREIDARRAEQPPESAGVGDLR